MRKILIVATQSGQKRLPVSNHGERIETMTAALLMSAESGRRTPPRRFDRLLRPHEDSKSLKRPQPPTIEVDG